MLKPAMVVLAMAVPAGAARADELPVYMDGELRVQEVSGAGDPTKASGERSVFYQVAYPMDWLERGLGEPMCAPCDHAGDGVTWTDFHDHLFVRGDLPERHVFNIGPAYTGEPERDAEVADAYAEQLPVTSAVDANRLLAARMPDDGPVAELTDLGFSFVSRLSD